MRERERLVRGQVLKWNRYMEREEREAERERERERETFLDNQIDD